MKNVYLGNLDVAELRQLIDECEHELEDRLEEAARMWREARGILTQLAAMHPALTIPFERPVENDTTLLDLDMILPHDLDFYDY